MNATIELTEQEIKELKERWAFSKLEEYSSLKIWDIKNEIKEKLLENVRQQSSFGRDYYLTGEFKDEIKKTFKDQVGELVDEQVKDLKHLVKGYVHDVFMEIIRDEVEEMTKNIIVTYQPDEVN